MGNSKNTVIPPGFKVTRCPPAVASGRSVYKLLKEEEAALEAGFSGRVEAAKARVGTDTFDAENAYEREAEVYGAALASGCGSDAAMEEVNYYRAHR